MAETTGIQCGWCEDALEGGELESPTSVGDEIVCDDCYNDWFDENSFDCAWCCEQVPDEDESDIFLLFADDIAVRASDEPVARPGVYLVLKRPCCTQSLIGHPTLWGDAVSRIDDLPKGVPYNNYPAAFLCKTCAQQYSAAYRIPEEANHG